MAKSALVTGAIGVSTRTGAGAGSNKLVAQVEWLVIHLVLGAHGGWSDVVA